MSKLAWDQVGEKVYETGVDRGVLYLPDAQGDYVSGYAWNGLTTVTESPSGAESNKQYADNRVYANLLSAEEFGCTIEAFTYPDEFEQCDGTAVVNGVSIGQQSRKAFGFAYRTLVGNDVDGTDFGYKLHLVYGALAAPSEKSHATVNDSPELVTFSWEVSTTAVDVGMVNGENFKPTATLTVPSNRVDSDALASLEDILYGTAGADPRLPLPGEVLALFSGTVTEVTPTEPTKAGNDITIPTVTGVVYRVDGEPVTGTYTMTEDTVVTATPEQGYTFPAVSDDDWYYAFA